MKAKEMLTGPLIAIVLVGGCADKSLDPNDNNVSEPSAVEQMVFTANNFINLQDSLFTFDEPKARAANLDENTIQLGEYIAGLATDALAGREIQADRFERLTPFFVLVAENVMTGSGADGRGGVGKATALETHCPPPYGMSTYDAAGWLRTHGYHLVPSYASGNYGRDYAKFITTSHYPASFWPFWTYRNQGIAAPDNHSITFQDIEPNPELAAYPWNVYPGAWWGPFVVWWHRYYC